MIEQLLDTFESYVLNNYQSYLDRYTSAEIPLNAPSTMIRDYTDFDKYTAKTVFYCLPESVEYDYIDVNNIDFKVRLVVYIFVRKESHDTLLLQTLRHQKAFAEMLKENQQLDGSVLDSEMIDGDIFLDVEGNTGIKGFKLNLDLTNSI